MQVQIRHAPSFAVARVNLAAGESVRVESGAMMAISHRLAVEAKAEGVASPPDGGIKPLRVATM